MAIVQQLLSVPLSLETRKVMRLLFTDLSKEALKQVASWSEADISAFISIGISTDPQVLLVCYMTLSIFSNI